MIKRFCDFCGKEIVAMNSPGHDPTALGRLQASLKRGSIRLDVQVVHSTNDVANKGDFCKYCILDALYQLDDRPKGDPVGRDLAPILPKTA